MRLLNTNEVSQVAGSGKLADLLKKLNPVTVLVNVIAKPQGSVNVDVKSPLSNVLVNVIWGK